VSKINWNGSRKPGAPRPAQPGRELRAQPWQQAGLQGASYLTLAVAFAAVAAGSVGATVLAMSLMSADVPELAKRGGRSRNCRSRGSRSSLHEASLSSRAENGQLSETPAAIAA
jgi:hypothetical protein